MQRHAQTEQELLQTLHGNITGTLVVTGNDRAARALRQSYNRWQRGCGNTGWITPRILAWEPWLNTLWEASTIASIETRALLQPIQEMEVWRSVLQQDETAKKVLSVGSLAELAGNISKEMHRYSVPLQRIRGDNSLDTQGFYRWSTAAEKIFRKYGFLAASQLEETALEWIRSNKVSLPEEILLVGFDRVTPSQALLIEALTTAGCQAHFVELHPDNESERTPTIVFADTQEQEIVAAAQWIRQTLLADSSQRIGVLVPALAEMRDAIDATFRRILAPGSMDVCNPPAPLPYEFSLGTPMHRVPAIRTALTLVQWVAQPLTAEEVSWLLVHGGFGAAPSKNDDTALDPTKLSRASLDRRFRDRNFQLGGPVSLTSFHHWLSQLGNSPEFASLRRTAERLVAAAENRAMERLRSFAEWRETIEELLAAADWQLLRPSTSRDYQLARRWNKLLNDLSSLNSVSGPVQFSTALERLQHLAADTIFTLESRNAPVQIVGASESAGLVFDSIWWMGARSDAWPPRGNAQPFLPWSLQREARMPFTNPAEDYSFALRATHRILNSANRVIVSFALQKTDTSNSSARIPPRELILSPLLREALPEAPLVAAEEFLPEIAVSGQDRNISALETVEEEPVVPFQSDQVRGGVSFLKFQAACPFRAFAELRLGSEPLADLGSGLSPSDQGSVIHRVMHGFWQEVETQRTLLASTTEQHRQILRRHIHDALAGFHRQANEPWQAALLEIETDRVEARLLVWLEEEKKRPDFTVVSTENTLTNAQLAGIQMQCRVDRIDAVDNGAALIDYKTGSVNRNSCAGDRPDEPQLPAYAILRESPASPEHALAGVAFAGLHPKKIGFTVIDSLPSTFEKSPASQMRSKSKSNPDALSRQEMHQQEETWRAVLTRLAENFKTGMAVVDPKKRGETCRYCAQAILCRINETQSGFAEAADDEDAEDFSDEFHPE